jgi:hypothetical protein
VSNTRKPWLRVTVAVVQIEDRQIGLRDEGQGALAGGACEARGGKPGGGEGAGGAT